MKTSTPLLFVTLLLFSCIAVAQDLELDPLYESISLTSGFTPDPYTQVISVGNQTEALLNSIADGDAGDRICAGFITNAPLMRVDYTTTRGSMPLIIGVESIADTTLFVIDPDGTLYCDDDSGVGLNPMLEFIRPKSGIYDIWVGTYDNSTINSATISISEVGSARAGAFDFEADLANYQGDSLGGIVGALAGILFVSFLVGVFYTVVAWKIFTKAGQPGWSCLVPIYNLIVLLRIAERPTWWLLLLLIPVVQMAFGIIIALDIGARFGKSTSWTVFMLIILGFIGYPILAFGKDQYVTITDLQNKGDREESQ